MASRRTKLGLDDKPWSFNRVGLERAGGHKFKFSYGTIGEAMEQLTVENKERKRRGWPCYVAGLAFGGCLFRCFVFVLAAAKGTFNSSKHPFRIITIGAGRATQVEICSCFGL